MFFIFKAQKDGTLEYKPSKETRDILLTAGKYFVFGKQSESEDSALSVGLGYDRYCRSRYNAFASKDYFWLNCAKHFFHENSKTKIFASCKLNETDIFLI